MYIADKIEFLLESDCCLNLKYYTFGPCCEKTVLESLRNSKSITKH